MGELTEDEIKAHMQKINPTLAQNCISYIEAMLSDLNGSVNDFEFRRLYPNGVDGLFDVVYLCPAMTDANGTPISRDEEKRLQNAIFNLANNLAYLKFTRVRNGLEYNLAKARIEAQKTSIVHQH